MIKLFAGQPVSSCLAPPAVVGASGWQLMAELPMGRDLHGGFASSERHPNGRCDAEVDGPSPRLDALIDLAEFNCLKGFRVVP